MTDSTSDLGYFRGQQVPESTRMRLLAAQLAQQSATQSQAPYTSGGVNVARALLAFMGGAQERQAIQDEQQAQAAHRQALAQVLLNGTTAGSGGAPTFGNTAASAAGTSPSMGIPTSAAAAAPMSSDARDLAIRTIYGEAGGEPDQGKAGVAAVLKNRLAGGQYGSDMQSVILAPKQFSLWNKGDPAGDSARRLDPSSPAYQKIGAIYDGVMSGQIKDPTGGATHYYNPNAASPAWGPKLAQQNDVRIGNHRFVGTGPTGPGNVASAAASAGTLAGGQGDDTLAPAASPFGAPPQAMATPAGQDNSALIAALRQRATGAPAALAGNPGPDTVLPPVVPPPQGSLTAPSPFGAGPQPMAPAPTSPNSQALAAALRQSVQKPPTPAIASPATPDGMGLSAAGLQMAALGGGDPSTLAGMVQAAPPVSAAPLSTDNAAGFDNLNATMNPDGTPAVTQSSLGAAGFTGAPADGSAAAAINGNLPGPQAYVGGSMGLGTGAPDPSAPSPAMLAAALKQSAGTPTPAPMAPPTQPPAPPPAQVAVLPGADDPLGGLMGTPTGAAPSTSDIATAAMAKAGYDTSTLPGGMPPQGSIAGLGPAASATVAKNAAMGQPPMLAGANVPPPDLSGLGAPTTPPPPGAALPIMARASSNPPAVLAQALRASSPAGPSMRPAGDTSLPETGPMPPPGAQTLANADAPAPGAANAGPAPVPPSLLAQALRGSQPNGLAGDGGADPSSARAFLTSQAQGQSGGASPSVLAQVLRGNSPAAAPAPAAPAASTDSSPLDGLGRLFGLGGGSSGGNPLAGIPIIGNLLGGGQSQQAPSVYGGGQGQQGAQFTPGGQGVQPGQVTGGQVGGSTGSAQAPSGVLGMSQGQLAAVLSDPRTTPAEMQFIMSRLSPAPEKLSAGEGLVVRNPDGTFRNVASQPNKPDWTDLGNGMMVDKNDPNGRAMPIPGGRAPFVLSPGQVQMGPNGPIASVPATPHYEPVPGTGQAIDTTTGRPAALPAGAGSTFQTIKVNGLDVPMRITPDPNGGSPKIEVMAPGAAGFGGTGQPAGGGGPISFNGTPQAAAPQGGPLDAIAPLARQAGQLKADEAAQVKEADTQVGEQAKIAQAGRDARVKLAQLDQLEQLSGKFGNNIGTKINAKLNEWGLPTQSGTDQDAFRGLVGALAVGERPAGSGALRVAEMDAFKSNLGDASMNQAGRIAAINRYRTVLQRDAQIGDLAADTTLSPGERATRIQTLSQQPYTSVGGTDGSGTTASQGGAPTASAAPPQAAPAPSDALAQAQAAIARGAPRAAVIQRLQAAGINPAGL